MAKKKQPEKSIQELLHGVDLSEQEAKALSERRQKELLQLRKRIKAGETTGDKIRDFVIACHGYPDTALVARYREIDENIARFRGQFVLLVMKEESFHGCTGFGYQPRPNDLSLDVHLCLGVVALGKLILDPKIEKCAIPTCGKHVVAWPPHNGTATEKTGDIFNNHLGNFVEDHRKPLKCKNPMHQLDTHFKVELRIGDQAVADWFTDANDLLYGKTYENMAAILGRPIASALPAETKSVLPELRAVLLRHASNGGAFVKSLLERARKEKLKDSVVITIEDLYEQFGVKAP